MPGDSTFYVINVCKYVDIEKKMLERASKSLH